MFEVLLIASSIFGHGLWSCESLFTYETHNIKEAIIMDIVQNADSSYSSEGHIIHTKVSTGGVLIKLKFREEGKVNVSGNTFSKYPSSVSLELASDMTGRFNDDILSQIKEHMSKPVYGLEIADVTAEEMKIKHQESGAITSCIAPTKPTQQ